MSKVVLEANDSLLGYPVSPVTCDSLALVLGGRLAMMIAVWSPSVSFHASSAGYRHRYCSTLCDARPGNSVELQGSKGYLARHMGADYRGQETPMFAFPRSASQKLSTAFKDPLDRNPHENLTHQLPRQHL